jgi:DNA-binding GntR family transcriptional regulator
MRIFNVEGGPQRGQIHHKRILEAIERHDPEMARSAMRSHLEQVREDSKAPAGIPSSPRGKQAPVVSKVSS